MTTWTTCRLPSGEERLQLESFRVTVVRGPDKGLQAVSEGSEFSIGAGEGCSLRLSDTTVSRHHCLLEVSEEGVRLRDAGSLNGVRFRGVRLFEAVLALPSQLELGRTVVQLESLSKPLELPLYSGESFGPLFGHSIAMRRVFALLDRAARTEATVLLTGESGTGKDLAAEAIHQASARSAGPFVVVDCGALPESLIESELFGHERGAFTGATERRVGAFQAADGGTGFLDEIGELPLSKQAILLRVLERRTVKPVGATSSRAVDVRFIAATNRDLRAEVNAGTFREDLYFRLSVVAAHLPPLRARQEDIPLLAERFRRSLAPDAPGLTEELTARLSRYAWPGNVRELRHAVERAVALGEPWALSEPAVGDSAARLQVDPRVPFKESKAKLVQQFEREYLSALIQQTEGNASAAARQAGIDRVHLLKLLRQHGLR